jgi:hypothetical protein
LIVKLGTATVDDDKEYYSDQVIDPTEGYGVFPGQQDGERILYTIRAHPLMLGLRLLRNFILFGLFCAAWFRGGAILTARSPGIYSIVWWIFGFLFIVAVWWDVKYFRSAVAYVTDRRIIRFIPSFPVTYSKRMVFWREVLKTKSVSDNVLWRLLKVGNLEVVPKTGGEQSLLLRSVHYYEDLGNYFDKLVYLTNAEPHQLKTVRPFVALPKWERYPQELDIQGEEEPVLIDHRSSREQPPRRVEYKPKAYVDSRRKEQEDE